MILLWALIALVSGSFYWDNIWAGVLSFAIVGAISYSGNQGSLMNMYNKGGR